MKESMENPDRIAPARQLSIIQAVKSQEEVTDQDRKRSHQLHKSQLDPTPFTIMGYHLLSSIALLKCFPSFFLTLKLLKNGVKKVEQERQQK